jgi:hypothetical protein
VPPLRQRVFVTYSHRDRRHLDRLRVHLRPLERQGILDVWDDTRLALGSNWQSEIAAAIAVAKAAIVLVSADFLASSFIADHELPPLLEAARHEGAAIFPVIVGPCRFSRTPELASFQAANDPARPLATLPAAERERIWVKVAAAVEAALANREITEGWAVANERRVLQSLHEVVNGPTGTFLIVSSGDYYVQFLNEKDRLHFEAVSNNFLPESLQLSEVKQQQLRSLGFDAPSKDIKNYSRIYPLESVLGQLHALASLAVRVLAEVYDVSKQAKLELEVMTQ